jgi:hypothetical protein
MHRKWILGTVLTAMMLLMPSAFAAGTRTTASTAPGFPSNTDLSQTSGTVSSNTSASATTTEVVATGGSWSVTAQICGPDNYATPTAPDCTNKANRIVSATGSILGSQISVTRGQISASGVPHGTAVAGTQTNLSAPITLMSSTDEVSTTLYNGVYSVTTGLTINNLSQIGTWKAYWVVTQFG